MPAKLKVESNPKIRSETESEKFFYVFIVIVYKNHSCFSNPKEFPVGFISKVKHKITARHKADFFIIAYSYLGGYTNSHHDKIFVATVCVTGDFIGNSLSSEEMKSCSSLESYSGTSAINPESRSDKQLPKGCCSGKAACPRGFQTVYFFAEKSSYRAV